MSQADLIIREQSEQGRWLKVAKVVPFDIRHLLNGFFISYLYSTGRVDTTLPLPELRRRSRINDAAQAAGDVEDFSQRIRASPPAAQP